jgi:hypothetical protein
VLDVEARNKEVEKRINAKDSYADFMAKKYFESLMGGVMLKNAHYDPEKEMMYADLVSAQIGLFSTFGNTNTTSQ